MCKVEISTFEVFFHIAVLALGLITALFIFFRDRRNPANRNIALSIVLLSYWTLAEFLQRIARDPEVGLFFFRSQIILTFAIIFFLFFAYHFAGRKIDGRKRIELFIPFIPLILFMFSDANGFFYDRASCLYRQGILNWYAYILGIGYAFWSVAVLLRRYRDNVINLQMKSQIKLLSFAVIFVVLWMILFMEIGDENLTREILVETHMLILAGALFFILLIFIGIVEYNLFEFGTVPTRAFSVALCLLLFLILFFLNLGTLFSLIVAALYLILIMLFWVF